MHPLTKIRFRRTLCDGSAFEAEIEVQNGSVSIHPVEGLQVTPIVPGVAQAKTSSVGWKQWVLEALKWLRTLGSLTLL